MLNSAILMGRITADPELKYTTGNVPVTSFTIAVDRAYKSGEERQTDFINIVAWRQRAEFVSRWFNKGQLIAVEGSIQTRKYTDKDGNNRIAFEVVANNVHFAGSKNEQQSTPPMGEADPLTQLENDLDKFGLSDDDDLPF